MKWWFIFGRLYRHRFKIIRVCMKTFLFLLVFVYLNYRFNMPVFHVFKNNNLASPCVVPKFDLYDSSIQQFFWKQYPISCEEWLDLFFVDENGYITINQTAIAISGFSNVNFTCEYRYITRVSEEEMSFSAKNVYTRPSYLNGDFIHMECHDNKGIRIYNNLHTNIDTKSVLKKRALSSESNEDLSVYIIGLDSVSRLIAERKLRKTMNYLRNHLHAFIFKGFTRIADSSYPNICPLFSGLKPYFEDRMGVNNLPYIFKNFSQKGTVDLFAEDWYTVASFKGFKEQPTQHYIQPLFQAMDKVRPFNLPLSMTMKFLQMHNIPLSKVSAMCSGNMYRYQYQIRYVKRFIQSYHPKRKFIFSWINELAHDFFNMVELSDNDHEELFKWMKNTGKLENAILIFMADHGPRYSEIQNTEVGRLSNLLPLLAVVIPDHIRSKYPHIEKNLKSNTERLVTTYDIHEMLKNILNSDFKEKERLVKDSKLPRGISLFREIPSSRSCLDADISGHYCPCYSSTNISTTDKRVIHSTNVLIERIRDILKDDLDKCAKVTLLFIQSASLVFADMTRDSQKERSYSLRSFLWTIEERTRFRIVFRTNPGNALFESTVKYGGDNDVKIIGDINRINKYGNQSACIQNTTKWKDKMKRLYCYCIF